MFSWSILLIDKVPSFFCIVQMMLKDICQNIGSDCDVTWTSLDFLMKIMSHINSVWSHYSWQSCLKAKCALKWLNLHYWFTPPIKRIKVTFNFDTENNMWNISTCFVWDIPYSTSADSQGKFSLIAQYQFSVFLFVFFKCVLLFSSLLLCFFVFFFLVFPYFSILNTLICNKLLSQSLVSPVLHGCCYSIFDSNFGGTWMEQI